MPPLTRRSSCSAVESRSAGTFATIHLEKILESSRSGNAGGAARAGCFFVESRPELVHRALEIVERADVLDGIIGARLLQLGGHFLRDHVHRVGFVHSA